jgi:hypothetical protein
MRQACRQRGNVIEEDRYVIDERRRSHPPRATLAAHALLPPIDDLAAPLAEHRGKMRHTLCSRSAVGFAHLCLSVGVFLQPDGGASARPGAHHVNMALYGA